MREMQLVKELRTLHPTIQKRTLIVPPVADLGWCEGEPCVSRVYLGELVGEAVAVVVTRRPAMAGFPEGRDELPVCVRCVADEAAYWSRAGRFVAVAVPASVGDVESMEIVLPPAVLSVLAEVAA